MSETPEPGWGGEPRPQTDPYAAVAPPVTGYDTGQGYPRHDAGVGYPGGYGQLYPGDQPQRTSTLAMVAFGCSLAAWFIAPLIGAIVALVLANMAADEIRKGGGAVTGQWAITAARVIAWANIAVSVLFILFAIFLLSVFTGFG